MMHRVKQTVPAKPQSIQWKPKISSQYSLAPYPPITKLMLQLGPVKAHSTSSTAKEGRGADSQALPPSSIQIKESSCQLSLAPMRFGNLQRSWQCATQAPQTTLLRK